jgi:hypothetical protein
MLILLFAFIIPAILQNAPAAVKLRLGQKKKSEIISRNDPSEKNNHINKLKLTA